MICLPISLLVSFGLMHMQHNPILEMLNDSRAYLIWTRVSTVIGFLAATVKLASGIGLLKMQAWARLTAIGYGIYAIIAGVIGMIMTTVILVPMMQRLHPGSGPEGAAAVGGMIGGIIGGIGGSCIGLVYPILLLIFMTRPKIKAAFQPQP